MKKILIIDDDENILYALARLFQKEGVEIVTAASLQEAERIILSSFFHIVISDLQLTPEKKKEGFQVLSLVRKLYPASRVAIMTAFGTPEIKQEAYELGTSFYFEKHDDIQLLEDFLDKK